MGFRFGLTFDPEPADARRPMTIPRFSLSSGSPLPAIVENLRVNGTRPRIQRLVGLRVSSLYRADPAETERLLGAAIERVRTMGATAIVMEGVEPGPDGRLAAWFPTTHLPVRADVYLRFAWQFQTRAGVRVYGRIPVVAAREATGSDEATMALFRDFGIFTSMDGLLFKDMPTITAGGDAGAGAAVGHPAAPQRDRRGDHLSEGAPRLRLFQSRGEQAAGAAARGHDQRDRSARPGGRRRPHARADAPRALATRSAWRRAWRRRVGCVASRPGAPVSGSRAGRRLARPTSSAITRALPAARRGGRRLGRRRPDRPIARRPPRSRPPCPPSIFPREVLTRCGIPHRSSSPRFTFGYPFVMAWYWMTGGVLYGLVRERHEPRPGEPPPLASYPPVSILVPCHNEGDNAREVFAALDAVDYPDFEIVGINDGSRDNTGEILDELAARMPRLRVVHLARNRGKALALNAGAIAARHEIIVAIDGDSLLDRDAVTWFVRRFLSDGTLGGLTGNPRIRNRSSLLARLQVGEYSAIVGLIKRAQTIFGWVFTVSGVVCAFRKRALHEAGWWSPATLTDDVDITWRIQMAGWSVAYEPKALVLDPDARDTRRVVAPAAALVGGRHADRNQPHAADVPLAALARVAHLAELPRERGVGVHHARGDCGVVPAVDAARRGSALPGVQPVGAVVGRRAHGDLPAAGDREPHAR